MGITDLFSDLYASLSFTELHADAAPEQIEEAEGEDKAEGEEGKEESGESEQGGEDEEGGEEKEEEDADEEEEEEEEPEDIKPKLEEGMSYEVPNASHGSSRKSNSGRLAGSLLKSSMAGSCSIF